MVRPTAKLFPAARSSRSDVRLPRIVVRECAVRMGAAKARGAVSPRTSAANPTTTVARARAARFPRGFFAAQTCRVASPPGSRARNQVSAATPRPCAMPTTAAKWPTSVEARASSAPCPAIVARMCARPASRASWLVAMHAPPRAPHAPALRTAARQNAAVFPRAACPPSSLLTQRTQRTQRRMEGG